MGESVRSVLCQTVTDFEVLIIDDGSVEDPSDHIPSDPRVRLIYHDQNQGYAAVTNTAVSCAHGRWIMFLDADDTIRPHYLQVMLDAGESTSADVVFGRLRAVDTYGHESSMPFDVPGNTSTGPQAIAVCLSDGLQASQHALFRINALSQPSRCGNVYSDMVFVTENLAPLDRVTYVRDPGYRYYIHSESVTGRLDESVWDLLTVPQAVGTAVRRCFGPSDAARLLSVCRGLAITTIMSKAARDRRDSRLRKYILASCHSSIAFGDIFACLRTGRKRAMVAGLLLLVARTDFRLYLVIYRAYLRLKRISL